MSRPAMRKRGAAKQGLTPAEKKTVAAWKAEVKTRWEKLLERNQWKPTK